MSTIELMLLYCDVGEDSWESFCLQVDQTLRKSVLNIHWKCWCWNSNTLATWWKELSHWKRPWCWKNLKAGKERGWHNRLNGHVFEQASGDGVGQGSLEWWSPWGCNESDMTERLNWLTDFIKWIWHNNMGRSLLFQVVLLSSNHFIFSKSFTESVKF